MMDGTPLYDTLTGAYTRALLHEQLRSAVDRGRRYGETCSLLVFDLDHFKSINDAFGHARGDQVLAEVARRVRQSTRASDQLFRYGGDEFVLLLPNTPNAEAAQLAQRLLDAIRSQPFDGEAPLSMSLSIGVASFPSDADDDQSLFLKADARNYEAKRRGRSCVVAEDTQSAPALPFAEGSRLIERDHALELAHEFLTSLATQQTAVFQVVGSAGSGRTRMLSELEKRARMQGHALLKLQGARTLHDKPYGALAVALPELFQAGSPRFGLEHLSMALEHVREHSQSGCLLICIDDLPLLDWGTLDLLRQLLASRAISQLGLIYTTDPHSARLVVPFSATTASQTTIGPLSPIGLRIWLRILLQWEPPETFLEWLHQQTEGLPAHIERHLLELVKNGGLIYQQDHWQLNQDSSFNLAIPSGYTIPRSALHNLPAALTSFIGREHELADLRQLLGRTRLLTLVGTGGMGKTRLSLEAAAALLDTFRDGIWFVELAPLIDPTLVPATIAAIVGVREEQNRPLLATLLDWLSVKQLLLILDNCEHLIDACAEFADRVLRNSPDIRILASSREPFDITGEQIYRVPPLDMPRESEDLHLEMLVQQPAARLFIERATLANAALRVREEDAGAIAHICRQLDGIPLALELAAARIKTMEIAEIAAGLDDRFQLLSRGSRTAFPRHQTLRALLDWSHSLLSESERILLRRLSVFSGGWNAAAAEEICAFSSETEHPILDGIPTILNQLATKSLIIFDDQSSRYRMLETIRQYARVEAEQATEVELLDHAHLVYYASLAETSEATLLTRERAATVQQLLTDNDNLRAALDWGAEHEPEQALRLVGSLGWFWYYADMLTEGRSRCERLFAQIDLSTPHPFAARALCRAGMVAANIDYVNQAQDWLNQCIRQSTELGRYDLISEAINFIGYTLVQTGQDAQASELFHTYEPMFRQHAQPTILGWILSYWGRVEANATGNYAAAKLLHDEALAIGEAYDDPALLAATYMNLGQWAAAQGDYPVAYHYHYTGLVSRRAFGTRLNIAISLHYCGDMLSMQGLYKQAEPLYAESLSHSRATGDLSYVAWTAYRYGYILTHLQQYTQALSMFSESMRIYRAQNNQDFITSCLAGCAEFWRTQEHLDQAIALLSYVSAHPQSRQRLFIIATDHTEYEHTLNSLREQSDTSRFEVAWATGLHMSTAQACEYALNVAQARHA